MRNGGGFQARTSGGFWMRISGGFRANTQLITYRLIHFSIVQSSNGMSWVES
jgi:hypothetical protein